MKNFILVAFSIFILFVTACTPKTASKELNLAIWGDYMNEAVKAQFEKETGIKVNISNYSSNEELLAKVQSSAGGIDMAVPSDYMVGIMAKLDLLERLDKNKIPNQAEVLPEFLSQEFDPANEFSLPYAWSTVGIAYNTKLVKNIPTSWHDLFDSEYKGRLSVLDDVREAMAMALKHEGFSVNTTKPAEIAKAKEVLLKLKPNLKMFRSDTIEPLANKEIAVAHVYSTSGIAAEMHSQGEIKFVMPSEGGTKAIDNMVIFKGSKNSENAHALMNFLLNKDANASFVKTIYGGPVVKGVKEILPENVRKHAALFPEGHSLEKYEFIRDLGKDLKMYDESWTQVKTQ